MDKTMITIPNPIKYDKDLHLQEMVTKFIDPGVTANIRFITHAIKLLKEDNAEFYLVRRHKSVAICRKGLMPAITGHTERYNFFALKNSNGNIITNGKNMRRPETMIGVLRGIFRRNPAKLSLLARNHDLPVAERCDLFGYELLKQNIPFS